jgi:hypothetical protein
VIASTRLAGVLCGSLPLKNEHVKTAPKIARSPRRNWFALVLAAVVSCSIAYAQATNPSAPARILSVEHQVEVADPGQPLRWALVYPIHQIPTNAPSQSIKLLNPNQGLDIQYDSRIRTGPQSRALISFSGGGNARIGPLSLVILKHTPPRRRAPPWACSPVSTTFSIVPKKWN